MKKIFVFFLTCIVLLTPLSAETQCQLNILLNQPYHEDGDMLAMDVEILSTGESTSIEFYACLEILGQFYFYPGFTESEIDFTTFDLEPGQTILETVIPAARLPDNLPGLVCTVYAAAFKPGTWELVSNLAVDYIRMQSSWEELPLPNYENTFYFMPGVEGLSAFSSQEDFDQIAQDLNTHFDPPGLYIRTGVSVLDGILDGENESTALRAAEKAALAGITIGYHAGVTPHHAHGALEELRRTDRRFNQWESDGTLYDTYHDDVTTVTLSRYAEPLKELRKSLAGKYGRGFANALAAHPDTVVRVNGPIEVELRRAFEDIHHYADYSPFFVMEFRDWLTGKGEYNAQTGQYAGQAFPMELIGDYDFSNDVSPNESAAGGTNFNQVFGTQFTTWNLLYWDPDVYPDPLPMDQEPKPSHGENGHTAGGFDPPRNHDGTLVGGNERFKNVWDGWRSNQHYDFRSGYGFRQVAVQQYVSDNARWITNGGAPLERNFTHQIPVDFLGNWVRERSSASPFWTAINSFSNAGYTTYFDTTQEDVLFLVTQMLSPRWGLFEYHPDPFLTQPLGYFTKSLEMLYKYRCHILVPLDLYEAEGGDYGLIGTVFETAVNEFFDAVWPQTGGRRFDQPYFNDTWINYIPPAVRNVHFGEGVLSWSPVIWGSRPDLLWTDWGEFDYFAIYRGDSADFVPNPSKLIATTKDSQLPGLNSEYHYKVLAVSRANLVSRY
jgi:hypothetical protein